MVKGHFLKLGIPEGKEDNGKDAVTRTSRRNAPRVTEL